MTDTEGEGGSLPHGPRRPGTSPPSPADRIGVTPTAEASRKDVKPPEATEARQRSEGSQRAARSWGERSPGGEPDPRRSARGSPDRGDRERHAEAQRSENRVRGGAVPSAGWREVAEALDAEAGQSHGGAATIPRTCGIVTPEVQQTTERGTKPVVSDE